MRDDFSATVLSPDLPRRRQTGVSDSKTLNIKIAVRYICVKMFKRKLTALDYHNPSGFDCKGRSYAAGADVVMR